MPDWQVPNHEVAAEIAREIRGDGLLRLEKSLIDACVKEEADCELLLHDAACIEFQVRRENFWIIRNEYAGPGRPPNKVRVRGDILDAWDMCQALAASGDTYNYEAPDENSGNEGGQGPVTGPVDLTASVDPKLIFGAGVVALVGALAWAKFRS